MLRTWFIGAAFALAACGGSSPTHFRANLSGANEVPSVISDGGGTADYTLDGGTVTYTVTFSGLTSNATMAHIHVGPAQVNGGITVPFSQVPHATSGTFSGTFTAANVAAASTTDGGISVDAGDFEGLLTLMRAGNTYTNVHTQQNPGGEIRGQNQPQ